MAVTQKNDKFLKKAFDRAIKLAGYAKDKLNAALVKPSASNLDIGDIILFNSGSTIVPRSSHLTFTVLNSASCFGGGKGTKP